MVPMFCGVLACVFAIFCRNLPSTVIAESCWSTASTSISRPLNLSAIRWCLLCVVLRQSRWKTRTGRTRSVSSLNHNQGAHDVKIKIEIKSTDVTTREIFSKKSGQVFHIREQTGYAHLGKAYPSEIRINLWDDAPGYPVGDYFLSPESYYVDKFGKLSINPRLAPFVTVEPVRKVV